MSTHTSSYDGEFEVTEADRALVAPLGTEPVFSEEDQSEYLVLALKQSMARFDEFLPRGRWDCFPDEGDWRCNEPTCVDHTTTMCGVPEHVVATRPHDPAQDDVFVRLPAVDPTSGVWDVEIFTRHREVDGKLNAVAMPCINGEVITPEDCVRDLGALLSVFRLFVQQGRI